MGMARSSPLTTTGETPKRPRFKPPGWRLANNLESAIVRTLAPGNYTAIVRGKNNTIGVALVEVYGLN